MVRTAMEIAHGAHLNQKDKGGYPYIFHPIHLAEQMDTEDEVVVALLHDVLEDSEIFNKELLIARGIPQRLIDTLVLLKHNKDVPYMEYINQIKKDSIACKVKLADLYHNSDLSRLREITENDIKRTNIYKNAIKLLESEYEKPNV